MAVVWTEEQKQVIDSRGQNLLVSAAAGSGKTAVLVQHVMARILDPVDPVNVSELLIVTFTRAAAAEMKERLRRRLEDALKEEPEHPGLRRQIAMVDQAHICTIDSFCSWLVKNYFHLLDIDPDFRILDESEAKLLQQDVMNELLEDFYGGTDPRFHDMMDRFSSVKEDGKVRDLIYRICRKADSMPFPEEWLEEMISLPESEDSMENFRWGPSLRQSLMSRVDQWRRLLEEADRLCSEHGVPARTAEMFRQEKEAVEKLGSGQTLDEIMKALDGFQLERKRSPSAKEKGAMSPEELALTQKLLDLRDMYKDDLAKKNYGMKRLASADPEGMAERIRSTADSRRVILELCAEYRRRYQRAKGERNLAEFGDVAHWALKLLLSVEKGEERPTELADTLGRQFREIIVDEYQDSSLIQEKLLTALSGERRGDPNMFMVGDVKQSIYRFREARPDLFMKKYDSYSYEDHKGAGRKIDLSRNFRSRKLVLESINQIFEDIMSPENGGIAYDEHARLYPGAARYQGEDLPAELILVDKDGGEGETAELEGCVIAARIRELTDPAKPMMIDDGEGGLRPVRYSDVVILLRSLDGYAEEIQQALALEDIPAYTERKKGYFEAPEILTLMSFLRILDNPLQDIPLAAVMRSPIGGFREDDLAAMAAEVPSADNMSFFQRCEQAAEHGICREQWHQFRDMLDGWRRKAVYLSIDDLLERFLEESGYGLLLSASVDGPVCMANVEMLMEQARTYETTIYHGIFNFLRYMDQVKTYDLDYGEASVQSEQGDLVRITTIHKSKGLEYPVVFLALTGKKFNLQDARAGVLVDEKTGLFCDEVDPVLRRRIVLPHKKILAQKMVRETCHEEMRLLYVALTRAKEKLICVGSMAKAEALDKQKEAAALWRELCRRGITGSKQIPVVLEDSCSSYLDWFALTVIDRPDSLWKVTTVDADSILTGEAWRIFGADTLLREWKEQGFTSWKDPAVQEAWGRAVNWEYPWKNSACRKSVYSVSELKHEAADRYLAVQEGITSAPGDRKAYETGENVGATRGTTYHLVLEKMRAENCTTLSGIREELDRLVSEELLLPDACALLSPDKLLRYYNSELGQRMIRAEKAGRLYKEQPFVMGVDPEDTAAAMVDGRDFSLVQGIIDAFLVEEGNMILWDYKTDRIPAGRTPEDYLVGMYREQLLLYKSALERARGGKVTEVWIYSFAADRMIPVPAEPGR